MLLSKPVGDEVRPAKIPTGKICGKFRLDRCYGNWKTHIPRLGVDITAVEKSVDNVENPSVSGKRPVESLVEKVDKKLHRG